MTSAASSPPYRRAPSAPAIDRAVLGEWLAGDDAAINELLVVFSDSVRAEQLRLHEALALGDLGECANAAHRLRGAALAMGARALADAAGAVYAATRAGDLVDRDAGLPELETQVRLMLAEVPLADASGASPRAEPGTH